MVSPVDILLSGENIIQITDTYSISLKISYLKTAKLWSLRRIASQHLIESRDKRGAASEWWLMWERRETQLAASLQITLIRPEQAGASAENTNLLVNNNPSQCSTSGPWPSTESMRITQSTKQCQSNTGQLRVLFINDCMEIWSNTVLHSVIETSTAMLVHNQVLGAMWEQSVQDIYSRTSKSCLDNKSWQFNSFRLKRGANKLQIKPLTYSDSRLKWSKVLRSIWLRNII